MSKNLTYGNAYQWMKKGYKLAREGWNGTDMFAVYTPGFTIGPEQIHSEALREYVESLPEKKITFKPGMYLKTVDGEMSHWVPSPTDNDAEDWYVID